MTYEYYAFSNKLKNVDGSEDENYTYDEIGNLIADEEEGIAEIQWTPYGKVRKVIKDDNSEIHFRYDASGNRIAKITATDTTVYARDASGNVMAVYKGNELEEQSIYGSSRLGLLNYASKTGYRSLGGKKYELSNHLGNVLAVVSDNIHLDQDSTWTLLINTTDYYPFGLAMDGRSEQDSAYRYGFNGKEEDSNGEWGSKSHYDYGFRIYNPSIAKFLSVDPLTGSYPMLTPYQYASNTPIAAIDLDGLEGVLAPPAPPPIPILVPVPPPTSGKNYNTDAIQPKHVLDDEFWGMGEPFRMLIKAYTPDWTKQKINPSQQEFDFLERRILDGESLDDEEVDRYVDLLEKVTGVYTWKRIHGNSKKSTKPQIIYRIYVVDTDETLKYGISGVGESRPKEQLKELKEQFGVEVDFDIVDRAPNNDEARQKEQKLVDDFFEREGLKPRAQKLPKSKYE